MSAIERNIHAGATGHRLTALIHCQYVYGIGHFVRTLELARGLSVVFDVFVLNGGETVPSFDFPPGVTCIQLPAIYKEEHLDHLSSVDRSLDLSECFSARLSLLDKLLSRIKVDVLITEHFPFGLLFEKEVTWLIKRVKECNPHAKVVSSVRDIVESEGGGQQDAHVCNLISHFYDMVLVHGDPEIVPLSASFPMLRDISVPLHHTGYLVQPPGPLSPQTNPPHLVVSVGGGRLGEELLYAALDAHRAVARKWPHQLLMFAGAFQRDIDALHARIEAGRELQVTLNAFSREGYRRALTRASALICMGGYNTLLESVAIRLPTLVYRRTFRGENTEQALRLSLLESAGLVKVLNPEELNSGRMAARILKLVQHYEASRIRVRMDGASESRRLLVQLVHGEIELICSDLPSVSDSQVNVQAGPSPGSSRRSGEF